VACAWWISAIHLTVLGGGLAYATGVEVRRLTRALPPRPPEIAGETIVRSAEDAAGHRASFRIMLFSDEFRWRLSSDSTLESAPAPPEFSPEMKAVLNDAVEIICIGTSSEEVADGVPFKWARTAEERRAARRAEQIAAWVRGAVNRPIPVRKLNIGQHLVSNRPGRTSSQRRVIIVLVLDRDARTDIDEALRSAMVRDSRRTPIFKALLTKYSLSTPRFTWVD
jgi:hypothetical protein